MVNTITKCSANGETFVNKITIIIIRIIISIRITIFKVIQLMVIFVILFLRQIKKPFSCLCQTDAILRHNYRIAQIDFVHWNILERKLLQVFINAKRYMTIVRVSRPRKLREITILPLFTISLLYLFNLPFLVTILAAYRDPL